MISKDIRPFMLSRFFGDINPKYKYLFKANKLKVDPKSLLVSNISEVKEFLKILKLNKEENIYKQLYLNVKKIFDILYEVDKILNVKYEDCNKSLSVYYYLDLLIKKEKYKINFAYSLDFIKNINNDNKKIDKPLTKLIMSKIILDLINNYINLDDYNEKIEEEEIKAIIEENISLIKNNFFYFKRQYRITS